MFTYYSSQHHSNMNQIYTYMNPFFMNAKICDMDVSLSNKQYYQDCETFPILNLKIYILCYRLKKEKTVKKWVTSGWNLSFRWDVWQLTGLTTNSYTVTPKVSIESFPFPFPKSPCLPRDNMQSPYNLLPQLDAVRYQYYYVPPYILFYINYEDFKK